MRTVLILGAGGYLGAALCEFFHGLEYPVIAVARRRVDHDFFSEQIVVDVFVDDWSSRIDLTKNILLINCAFDVRAVHKQDYERKYASFDRNIGTLGAARAARLINISSLAAFVDCRSEYGREKLFVENIFTKYGGINIRPGLIASWHRPGTAFLSILNIVRNSPFVPVLAARRNAFRLCDLEFFVLGIFLVSELRLNKSHTLSFCYDRPLTLRGLLHLIETRLKRSNTKISVPWQLAYGLLRTKETIFGKSKISADSVIDFAYPPKVISGRALFSRIVTFFRQDFAAKQCLRTAADLFWFLESAEDPPLCASTGCRLASMVQHALALLGCLADS